MRDRHARRAFVSVVVGLITLIHAAAQPSSNDYFLVRYVVDGDTLDIAGVGRVRLLGIDAPEFGRGFDTPAPFAREARDRLASLAYHRWVKLEADGDARDAYARTLAYVIRGDGLLINADIVRAGLARVSARRPLRRLGELRRAEEEAQRARRGMWGERPIIANRSLRIPRSDQSRPTRSSRSGPPAP